MNLLQVISSVDPKTGGPVEVVNQLYAPLKVLGVHSEVVSCDAPPNGAGHASSSVAKHHFLGPAHLGYGYTPRLQSWLRENASRYDAVIVNGLWQYHGLAVHRALSGTTTPYFIFPHGMLDPWFKQAYPLKHVKKWLYWPWAEYRILRDARAVIFTCEEERLLARRSFWLYQANEAVTSFGTARPPQENELARRFLAQYPDLVGKRIVLFLGRMHEKKGCDLLLDAFAQIVKADTRLHLLMAGPDETGWGQTLRSQAQRIGISDRITWVGMLKGEAKWSAYYAAEVFCLPSHQENFGIVVAEALACGKPVLISNKVNIWREISACNSGFVDEDTVAGTVRNLQQWLALDRSQYDRMCRRAHSCFDQNFDIHNAAKRLVEIIDRYQ